MSICGKYGFWNVWRYYRIPWLGVNHWCRFIILLSVVQCPDNGFEVIMITYLHHTDPILPHYRKNKWNYPRGAAATVDRDFLGWHGRFFFHDVAHFHVIHHAGSLQTPRKTPSNLCLCSFSQRYHFVSLLSLLPLMSLRRPQIMVRRRLSISRLSSVNTTTSQTNLCSVVSGIIITTASLWIMLVCFYSHTYAIVELDP